MNGSPSVTLTRAVEIERLDRDQRLVVIHAQRRVVAARGLRRGTSYPRRAGRARRCRRRAARRSRARRSRSSSRPRAPASPACGLSPATAMTGAQSRSRGAARRATTRPACTIAALDSVSTASRSAMWIVTGTTRSLRAGQHHHRRFGRPASSARYSVCPGWRKPARYSASLLIGLVTRAAARPPATSATARSIARSTNA